MHNVVLSKHVQGISCKSVVTLKATVRYKALMSEAGVPSCVYRGTSVMAIPFKITTWGKFIRSCIKHPQTGCRSGVRVQHCKTNCLLVQTRFQPLVLSCSIVQNISPSPALLLQPSASPGFAQALSPIPCRVWRNMGKSHWIPLYLMFPQGKSCLCCRNVGIK